MTSDGNHGSWCDIHLDQISRNLTLKLERIPTGRKLRALLKTDAYGHGIGQVVPLMYTQGVDLRPRQAKAKGSIYVPLGERHWRRSA